MRRPRSKREHCEGDSTRLALVFALDLQDVEEVGCGGVDLDEVVIALGDGIREVLDLELAGALKSNISAVWYIG